MIIANSDFRRIYDIFTTVFIIGCAILILSIAIYHAVFNGDYFKAVTMLYPAFATVAEGMLCSVWSSGGVFRLVLVVSAIFNLLLWG